MKRMAPHFVELEDELASNIELRDTPAGQFRITTTDYAAETILWPKLKPLLRKYPDIAVEFITDYALTDIIGEKIDAGVRLGEQVSEGMIAVSIGPDMRMRAVDRPPISGSTAFPKRRRT